MKYRGNKIISILLAVILSLQSIAPLPAVIAQENQESSNSSLNLDIQFVNVNEEKESDGEEEKESDGEEEKASEPEPRVAELAAPVEAVSEAPAVSISDETSADVPAESTDAAADEATDSGANVEADLQETPPPPDADANAASSGVENAKKSHQSAEEDSGDDNADDEPTFTVIIEASSASEPVHIPVTLLDDEEVETNAATEEKLDAETEPAAEDLPVDDDDELEEAVVETAEPDDGAEAVDEKNAENDADIEDVDNTGIEADAEDAVIAENETDSEDETEADGEDSGIVKLTVTVLNPADESDEPIASLTGIVDPETGEVLELTDILTDAETLSEDGALLLDGSDGDGETTDGTETPTVTPTPTEIDADMEMGGKVKTEKDKDGFVPLDFDGIPVAMKAMLDEDGIYQITFVIPEGTDAEFVRIDLARISEEISYLQGLMESDVFEPGDSRVINVWIKSESGHVYKYMDGSFLLRTPEMDESKIPTDPKDQVTGFDGQTLDTDYMGTDWFELSYMVKPIYDKMKEFGISQFDLDHNLISIYDRNQFFNSLKKDYGGSTNTETIQNFLVSYYSKLDDTTYADFTEMMSKSPEAYEEVRLTSMIYQARYLGGIYVPQGREMDYNTFYQDAFRWVYGEDDVMDATDDLKVSAYQYTTREVYDVYDYDTNPPELHQNCVPLNKLSTYYQNWLKRLIPDAPDDMLVEMSANGISTYFLNEDGEVLTASNSQDAKKELVTQQREYGGERKYSAWSMSDLDYIANSSIGDYMKDELDKAGEGAWDRANAYFNKLLGSGISGSVEEAAWVSFMMATNIDYYMANNNVQDTAWEWQNEITLERIDGSVEINKSGTKRVIDSRTKEVIEEENIETISDGETTFQIWYYKDDDPSQKYFLTKTTDESGESNQGFVFVKYDKDNTKMTWTIDTTKGKLNIDYAMLEGQVYYLQEVVAPKVAGEDGARYQIDTTVLIICDSEEEVEAAKKVLAKDSSVKYNNVKYAGAIDSAAEEPLKINIVNIYERTNATPTPTPTLVPIDEPTPTPVDDPPETPTGRTVTTLLEIGDYRVPLAGMINMNEGDCFD